MIPTRVSAVMPGDPLHTIPGLWRGGRMPAAERPVLSTGFAALDRELPGGGWPIGAVVELLAGVIGIGEVRLLLPLIRQLTLSGSHVVLVRPPYLPNSVLWQYAGIDPDRLLMIEAVGDRDALWSAEQALRNPACGAVLLWPEHSGPKEKAARRLQVAAADGQSILFLYRGSESFFLSSRGMHKADRKNDSGPCMHGSQWAALRLALLPAADGISIDVLKAAGTHRRAGVHISI
jgi:hypothetical protein